MRLGSRLLWSWAPTQPGSYFQNWPNSCCPCATNATRSPPRSRPSWRPHPLHKVLTSVPGIGVRTCARILTEVTGKHFASAAHLASYAGIAPVTRRSGTSIRGEHTSRRGNKKLKRALFLSAFAALHHPPSRAYYDRKRAEGKRHNQALIALARRRSDVLFAMLRDGTLYQEPEPRNLPSAA